MFADPFSAVMALILLAFIGTLAIFFRLWRELDALRRSLGDIREMLQYGAVDASRQSGELTGLARELRVLSSPQENSSAAPAKDALGDFLEKGRPSLEEASSPAEQRGRGTREEHNAVTEEEDFLRRFTALSSKDFSS